MSLAASQLYIQMIKHAYEANDGDYSALSAQLFDEKTRRGHHSSDTPVDIREINQLWKAISDDLRDPLFALKIGANIHPSDYGILGHVWMNSQNLLECIKLMVEYCQLMNDAFDTKYEIDNNQFIYNLAVTSLSAEEESHFVDHNISSIYYMGKFLIGPRYKNNKLFKQVNLRHQHNQKLQQEYEAILHCPVKMGQESNQVILDMSILMLPVYSPDEKMQKLMLTKTKKLADTSTNRNPVTAKVISYINKNMKGNLPTAEFTAKELGMSLSSLKRALKAEETSYQQVIDDERYRHAAQMLGERDHSVCEISFLLGYSNASSFSRAFKIRTGLSPKEYRNQQKRSRA